MNREPGPESAEGWFYMASKGGAETVLAEVWREFEYSSIAARTRSDLRHVEGVDYKVTVIVEVAK